MDLPFTNVTTARQIAALDLLLTLEWKPDPTHAFQASLLRLLVSWLKYCENRFLDGGVSEDPGLMPEWMQSPSLQASLRSSIQSSASLNSSQKEAIQAALTQRITLWQGPPGSGKTHTLLSLMEILCHTSRTEKGTPRPILVCAETNTAVDNLVYCLLRKRIRVVRIGPPAKASPRLLLSTLEARSEKTEAGQRARLLRQKATDLKTSLLSEDDVTYRFRNEMLTQQKETEKDAERCFQEACSYVLDSCEVVACTCSAAGDWSLAGRCFPMVIMDEATQSTEPSTLVPLLLGAQSLVMAGDPQQLPPTVLSRKAQKQGLDISLFARLQQKGIKPLLLDTQYRMHPQICRFPSQRFYHGKLKTADQCRDYQIPRAIQEWTSAAPVVFVRHTFEEWQKLDGTDPSLQNEAEAELAMQVLQKLIQPRDVKEIALLTPYRGQVTLLQKALDTSLDAAQVQVTASTIDSFQGRECDVAIFSTVRSNRQGKLGFLSDTRRMNVAITRVKKGLVVIGNPTTLKSSRVWSAWLQWVERYGAVLDASRFLS